MAGCFMIGELPEELHILGHDVPDPVIVSCLSQMQLTDHCYEKSTSLVTARAANDRSSALSCVRAGKSPRHEHGPPVPGDRDFRREADFIFPNCALATELQGLKLMLRVMGETKDELLGSLNGPGPVKRRIPQAEEDEDVGKLFSEWRLVGRTLRPIDNNVVAGDSFKASALAQNLKCENQFFEPLVYQADENTKGEHQFYEPLVPYSTNEHPEPTKPSHFGDSFKPASINSANTKKNHGLEPKAATFLKEHTDSSKCSVLADPVKPTTVVQHGNKENPVLDPSVFHAANEASGPVKFIRHSGEDMPRKLDGCHAHSNDTSLSQDGVTSLTMSQHRKETRKLIGEGDTALRSKGSSDQSEEEDTTSTDTTITSSDTLTTEEEDNASDVKGGQGRAWKTSQEYLREEHILKAAIEAGVSYYHDGVVYRENLVYDMLRSPSSGTQEDTLESNHDLEEFPKPAPRKKTYNPELFSLSNDHFLEAFERSLAELDPKDTIDQETFASVTRHSAEPEHFHQFNFASLSSLVNFRIEDENLLDFNSPLLIFPAPATNVAADRETADPLANLDHPSSLLSDSSKERNQFLLDEEAVRESAEEINQFFLEGDSLPESGDETKQVLHEHALGKDSSTNSVPAPTTPDRGAEVNPPLRKERIDTSRGLAFNQAKILEDTHKVLASALEFPTEPVSKGVEVKDAHFTHSSEKCDAAPGKAAAPVILPLDDIQGTSNTYQEEVIQRRSAVKPESGVRSDADHLPSNDHISTPRPSNFSSGEPNGSRFAGGLDRGISGHLEPLNDRSNIPTANADDHNQRPRPKTITDFFNPSEMTLRRPSTIEIKKRDKETRSLLRAAEQKFTAEHPVDHLRFALPPPSARGSSRRHSLSERSLEIAGLALTPIKVPNRDQAYPTHGAWDHTHGSGSQWSQGAPKRRGESRVFGASGSKSPQVGGTTHRKSGEAASPVGPAATQSPYGKVHNGFLKKGGGGVPSPSGSAAGSKTPQTPQSTTSSGSEASPKQNPFKRNPGIYSSLISREKRSGDGSSVLLSTSRLSTSVNLPSSSRMSTSVNLPSASERSSSQRQSTSRSNTESLHSSSSQKRSPAQDIKKASDSTVSKPAFSTSTTLAKSRTIPSTTISATKEKLTPGTARRTQSVQDRVKR